jgi:hypothetical protein
MHFFAPEYRHFGVFYIISYYYAGKFWAVRGRESDAWICACQRRDTKFFCFSTLRRFLLLFTIHSYKDQLVSQGDAVTHCDKTLIANACNWGTSHPEFDHHAIGSSVLTSNPNATSLLKIPRLSLYTMNCARIDFLVERSPHLSSK